MSDRERKGVPEHSSDVLKGPPPTPQPAPKGPPESLRLSVESEKEWRWSSSERLCNFLGACYVTGRF